MEGHSPQCKAMKLFITGLIILLARLYTTLDIWVVIGALLIVKSIILFLMPLCPCNKGKN